MRLLRASASLSVSVALVSLAVAILFPARPASQGTSSYTVYVGTQKRTVPYRAGETVDMVPLEPLVTLFGLSVTEDAATGGLTVQGHGQRMLLIPGQSFASLGPGRIVSIGAQVTRDRNGWQVPIDLLRQAIAPLLSLKIEVRRATHVVLVGDVHLPQMTGRFDRQGVNGQLTFTLDAATPHRVTRDGNRLTIHFDAVAVDLTPVPGLAAELVKGVRVDNTSVLVDLGSTVTGYHAEDPDDTHLVIALLGPAPPPPSALSPPAPAPAPAVPQPAPVVPVRPQTEPAPAISDLGPAGPLRTIVIDPGHGGEDEGAHGPAGTKEKDLVLQMARRLKTTIENRIGLRVLLTRDGDENVPADRRTALANNNKADLFVSLHANAAWRPETRGADVLTLSAGDYTGRIAATTAKELPVPAVSGGSRVVDVVPWDVAQLPYVEKSAGVAVMLTRHLTEQGVPLFRPPSSRLPLRPLIGANMPAILVEMGFLTNADDERALTDADRSGTIIEALMATITDLRRSVSP